MARILVAIGVLTASCWAVLAMAQTPLNSIEAFNVSQQSGKVIVKLTLKEALKSQPGSFTVANPARIAFDLPNTVNGVVWYEVKRKEGGKGFELIKRDKLVKAIPLEITLVDFGGGN